jgi:hypothetical protein
MVEGASNSVEAKKNLPHFCGFFVSMARKYMDGEETAVYDTAFKD